MIEDVQFHEVVSKFNATLHNYNMLLNPNKSNDFYFYHCAYKSNGIKYERGNIYVRKYRFLPFCYMYVGNNFNFVEGVPDCVKIVVERWFIEHTAYLDEQVAQMRSDDREREQYEETKKLNDLKKLRWLCK